MISWSLNIFLKKLVFILLICVNEFEFLISFPFRKASRYPKYCLAEKKKVRFVENSNIIILYYNIILKWICLIFL